MNYCSVPNCRSSEYNFTIQYHCLPEQTELSEQWISACKIPKSAELNEVKICSIHFSSDAYTDEYTFVDRLKSYTPILKEGAIPTLELPTENNEPITLRTVALNSLQDASINEIDFEQLLDTNKRIEIVSEEYAQNKDELNKYECTYSRLADLQKNNANMKVMMEQQEKEIKDLQNKLNLKRKLFVEAENDFNDLNRKYKYKCKTYNLVKQKKLLAKIFSEAQIKALCGKRIHWSGDDYAIGHTIWQLSNRKCYTYLKDNLHIPLPGISSIERWLNPKREDKFGATKTNEENSSVG